MRCTMLAFVTLFIILSPNKSEEACLLTTDGLVFTNLPAWLSLIDTTASENTKKLFQKRIF